MFTPIDRRDSRDYTLGHMYYWQTYRSNWWGYIGKRVLLILIAFILFSFIVFSLISYAGNQDIIDPWPGRNPTHFEIQEQIKVYQTSYVIQYLHWLGNFLTGNWGNSLIYRVPVKDILF